VTRAALSKLLYFHLRRLLENLPPSGLITRLAPVLTLNVSGINTGCVVGPDCRPPSATLNCRGTVSCREKGKASPYSISERRVPELIPVLGSQPAGDVSHKPGGRLPLLSARPAVTPATLKRAATSFAAW